MSIDYITIVGSSEASVTREWAIHAYKARLDSAIEAERWDEVDRVRVAAKRRLLEMVGKGGNQGEIAAARDALADSSDRLRLSKRLRIDKGALATATRLSADAETAGIATEQVPLSQDTARDVKERIMQILSSGNRRPWSTSDLAKETARRVETIARAVSQLRAERKITSRRIGRYVLHRIAEPRHDTLAKILREPANAPFIKTWISPSPSISVKPVYLKRVDHGDETVPSVNEYMPKIEDNLGNRMKLYSSLQVLFDEPDAEWPEKATEKMTIIGTKAPLISGI